MTRSRFDSTSRPSATTFHEWNSCPRGTLLVRSRWLSNDQAKGAASWAGFERVAMIGCGSIWKQNRANDGNEGQVTGYRIHYVQDERVPWLLDGQRCAYLPNHVKPKNGYPYQRKASG
jgi:hypothetical protein